MGHIPLATHDGVIGVTATAGNCVVKAELDLPLDLSTITWVFPNGCYEFCDEANSGYVIGPLDEFEKSAWRNNEFTVLEFSGAVFQFTE